MLRLAVYFDRLDAVSPTLSASRPGLMFRPPEHPGVLVQPADAAAGLEAASGATSVYFECGKSCLLAWDEAIATMRLDVIDLGRQCHPATLTTLNAQRVVA